VVREVTYADAVTWEDFERAVVEYRDSEFLGRSPTSGENAYLSLAAELSDVPMAERASHAASIVLFLNRWNCRFPREESAAAIAGWLDRESNALESLVGLSILSDRVPELESEVNRLYETLIDLRQGNPRIFTMSDAAASKLLGQMVPDLFVMWDSKIRVGFATYGAFTTEMNHLAGRLRDELSPPEARADIDGYLQQALGYPVKKPLAKYIDEYNWWRAWSVDS
jgi:hypothetical protein